jgi:hypothetical protein
MDKENKSRSSVAPSFDDSGVNAYLDDMLIQIKFSDIIAIYAYKKDCLTTDQIRVIVSNGKCNIELTEDDVRLDELNVHFERHLKVRPDWYCELISRPAFEMSWTVVYQDDQAMRDEATT